MAQGKNVYSEKITTPIGRFSYPSVFQKSKGMDGAEGKYEVTLLIPKTTDISALRKEMETIFAAHGRVALAADGFRVRENKKYGGGLYVLFGPEDAQFIFPWMTLAAITACSFDALRERRL